VLAGTLLDRALRDLLGLAAPHLAVCALNPHAGEGGLFGDEEPRLLAPAVATLRERGVDATASGVAGGVAACVYLGG